LETVMSIAGVYHSDRTVLHDYGCISIYANVGIKVIIHILFASH